MSTTKKHLVSFRSNTKFSLNYEDQNLTPQIEIIILSHEPEYKITLKMKSLKVHRLVSLGYSPLLKVLTP